MKNGSRGASEQMSWILSRSSRAAGRIATFSRSNKNKLSRGPGKRSECIRIEVTLTEEIQEMARPTVPQPYTACRLRNLIPGIAGRQFVLGVNENPKDGGEQSHDSCCHDRRSEEHTS